MSESRFLFVLLLINVFRFLFVLLFFKPSLPEFERRKPGQYPQ